MKCKTISFLFLLSFYLFINLCFGDLPIHCLQHQVVGDWLLQITEPEVIVNPYKMNCGHESPDNPANSYLAMRYNFKPAKSFKVKLGSNNKVQVNNEEVGIWTMIYDEGIDIIFGNQTFTTFFDYHPDESGKVMSYCGTTLVGWYHDINNEKKACFRAEKMLKNKSEEFNLYGTPLQQMYVVQPVKSFLQLHTSSREQKNLRAKYLSQQNTIFKNLKYDVEKLNLVPNNLWKVDLHSKFAGKSLSELNIFAGRRKIGISEARPTLKSSFIQLSDVSDLPKNFTWREYLNPAREQQQCGSCFIFATIQMIESRLKIKYKKDIQLSVQHPLDCSFHNQGCKGGYPYLIEKFAKEFDLVPETCSPYIGQHGACSTCDLSTLNEVYRVSDYKFVGGSYGKSNERDMMIEIMSNGPIVASFEPPAEFMFYKEGIFQGIEPDWVKYNLTKPEWEKVDHSVLLYGWGETADGVKYWELLNSWGEDWGEKGHFKMRRGVDECAIESLGEAANPIIVSRQKANSNEENGSQS